MYVNVFLTIPKSGTFIFVTMYLGFGNNWKNILEIVGIL